MSPLLENKLACDFDLQCMVGVMLASGNLLATDPTTCNDQIPI